MINNTHSQKEGDAPMTYIGIDPGKHGAFAWIEGKVVQAFPWDERAFVSYMAFFSSGDTGKDCAACLEHVSAMPGQGVTSMFTFGQNFGFIQGVLTAYGIPYELVRPQKWKKEFSITGDKNSSIAVCKRLFPNVSLLRTEKCRKEDDGLAEALLMALYAKRKFGE